MNQLAIALLCLLPTLSNANPHRDRGPQPQQVSDDHRREMRMALAEIKDKYPKKFAYLMNLREDDPMAFRKAMGEIMRQRKMGTFGKENPDVRTEKDRLKELKSDFRLTLEAHQNAAEAEKPQIKRELLEMAEDIFDSKQQLRRLRVKIIQEEITKLEAEIAERDASRDELITEFVDDKIGENLQGL